MHEGIWVDVMVLLLLIIATGWFYVCYLVGKSIVGFLIRRNKPISIGKQPQVKSSLFDKFLALASAVSFIVIIAIFAEVAYALLTVERGMIGVEFNLQRKMEPLATLFGVWFAPASMVVVVYTLYIIERIFGRAKSYPIELSTFPAAGYTIVAYLVFQAM